MVEYKMIFSGYIGRRATPFLPTTVYDTNFAANYCISDYDHKELNIILLQPGCFQDIYSVASRPMYLQVNIFAPSIDAFFVSDICLLATSLFNMKKVHIIHPIMPKWPINNVVQRCFIKNDHYSSIYDRKISIEYAPIEPKMGFFNFFIRDGEKTRMISSFLNDEIIAKTMKIYDLDEIHLPFKKSLYGGLTATDIIDNMIYSRVFRKRVIINSFSTIEEYAYCKNRHDLRVAKFVRAQFLGGDSI